MSHCNSHPAKVAFMGTTTWHIINHVGWAFNFWIGQISALLFDSPFFIISLPFCFFDQMWKISLCLVFFTSMLLSLALLFFFMRLTSEYSLFFLEFHGSPGFLWHGFGPILPCFGCCDWKTTLYWSVTVLQKILIVHSDQIHYLCYWFPQSVLTLIFNKADGSFCKTTLLRFYDVLNLEKVSYLNLSFRSTNAIEKNSVKVTTLRQNLSWQCHL